MRNSIKPPKCEIRVLVAPKWGLVGSLNGQGVLKMVLKTAERNFVKTVKISNQSEKALKSY